jgi:hypothetical protein
VKLLAGAAALLAIGAGLGTYFALGDGKSVPPVPKALRSSILEHAKADRVIDGYRVHNLGMGRMEYQALGREIRLRTWVSYCGDSAGPCAIGPPLVVIEYQHPAAEQARAIERIAQAQMPAAKVDSFEVTIPGG